MNYNTILINIDEIWIKGKNQRSFFDLLQKHVVHRIGAFHKDKFEIFRESHRMVAESKTPFSEEVFDILSKTPGIHSIDPTKRLPLDFDAIIPAALEDLASYEKIPPTFRVLTKRANKKFPIGSMEISRLVSGPILKKYDGQLKAKMKNPDLILRVRILDSSIYVSSRKIYGVGGLPVGSSDRLVTMLSGGFDSPVASYLMSKRGCDQTFIFFYAYPFVGEEVKEKIIDLTRVLSKYQRFAPLYIVPFGDIQKKIADLSKPAYRTILIRKAMVECSELLATRIGALGMLTGDALGQVSSQTMSSICFIDKSANMPILRPLIGYNKEEIISLSRTIGTHDISVRPHDDACALFAGKFPATRPNDKYWDYYNQEIQIEDEIAKALDDAEILRIDKYGQIKRKSPKPNP